MNIFITLLLAIYIFLMAVSAPPLLAVSGTTNITALVPEAAISANFVFSNSGTTTLTKEDGTTVVFNFPQNFYTEDLRLQANSYQNDFFSSDKPVISGKEFVGKTYDFSLYTTAGTQISVISAPITLTINYTSADLSGIDESTLAPYRWGSSDSSWQLISGATVDTANNKVTFSTANFSSFTLLGSPAQQPTPPVSGGGGGGGGGIIAPSTNVVFAGRAYPKSAITILKDAQIAATTVAGADAVFQIALAGLSAGNYIFSLYSEDNKGKRSALLTFPISVTAGATTKVSGIFIAPTIGVDKNEVKRGDNIAIFGQSAPQSDITVAISSEEDFFGKTVADKDGLYLYNFDTSVIDYGTHYAKSKAGLANLEFSSFSQTIGFKVGTKNIAVEPSKTAVKGDMNNDRRVNLVDFSIAAYWYKRPNPPTTADLNGDGKVDLVDFSIMAFYWTG